MAQSNSTNQDGSRPKTKIWRAIAQKVLDLLAANVTINVSLPFLRDEKWSILYGDNCYYRIHEYPDQLTAWREFRAIQNAILLNCGSPSCDFRVLDDQEVAEVVDFKSYRAVVARAVNGSADIFQT